ncbi:multidrug resistance-associated protein [Cordyceps fumosorosea ARSEF 2679]|uniref:Multidrug resistance-associated protein n=1 Tax=Cordyceps fumosorosea (strain ARSEF 2679) TaxID=1081104 RepID=A0A167QLU0_CORFA|nr:multidrug resistance-associated protein [Cordyceps fumosorosea ARSEF 2679]OAA57757.1 multidrug resistance-associated protein [Cordyceps fumosorosea ARSEF 2679]
MECIKPMDPAVQSITLSSVLLLFFPNAWAATRRSNVKVRPGGFLRTAKPITGCAVIAAALSHLVVTLARPDKTLASVFAVSMSLAAAVDVVLLSSACHKRALKSSSLLVLYLLVVGCWNLSTVSKLTVARHLDYRECILPVIGIIQLVQLLLECTSKRDIFLPRYKSLAPAETANFFSVVSFWWMNDLLVRGNKHILQDEDLPPLDSRLQAAGLSKTIKQTWSTRANPETKTTLFKVLLKTHTRQFITTLIPRLFMVLFDCSQPLLIKAVIRHVESPTSPPCRQRTLILGAAAVYLGSTLSSSQYLYRTARLQLAVKSGLTSLIHHKTLATAAHAADTGKATTVMGADLDAVAEAPAMLHDLVGRVLEVGLGLAILGGQVKWLWPVPLVIIFLCSRVSRFVARNVGGRQRRWNEATERRVGALAAVLGAMRSVKALGVTEAVLKYVDGLRGEELARAGEKRFLDCQYNSSANALGVFSPALTVALFAIVSHFKNVPLDTAVLFTTVAALSIVTHPANMIMTIYPRIVSVAASFERFQEFLLASPLEDTRKVEEEEVLASSRSGIAASLTDLTIHSKNGQPILDNIDLKLPYGSVTVCCGPVGSGKSVLGKAILGELPAAMGLVEVSSKRIGFCDQAPWVMAGTVKEVICAFASPVDEARYRAVVQACCLDHDLSRLAEGDDLRIGSRGVNLSGGQKQRIALARLLYTGGAAIVVLDDSFAALDGTTESSVVQNLLGPAGLLRQSGAAIFWITNSAQYFHLADHILLLDAGRISRRGTAVEMSPYVDELRKFHAEDASPGPEAPTRRAKTQAKKDAQSDLYRQTGDLSLYGFYLRSTGALPPLAVVGTTATYAVCNTVPTYWIKFWADRPGASTAVFALGYLLIALFAWAATTVHMWTTVCLLAPRSGLRLHRALAGRILGAPLSYFVATDVGVTLNRFGQDVDLVDRQLPGAFARFATQCCKMTAQVVVMSLVQPEFAMAVPVCALVVYVVQRVYLRTSRQLRIDGLATIRAFGWQRAVEQRNIDAIDLSMRPVFLMRCLNRWLLIVLELIVSTVAVAIVASAVMGGSGTGTGTAVGVALNLVILTNTTLIALVISFTDLEVSLGAISRLKEVEEMTPQEDLPHEIVVPDAHWPTRGELVLKDLATGYRINNNVLSHVDLVASAGQKLIVCGRTGSGKSTIFVSLLRLIESTGAITVDGTNILNMPRSIVRSRCFIAVPQDGIVFKDASLRFNLDPTGTVGDDILRDALKSTHLWTVLSDDETTDILDLKLSSLPPLSAGQQQLFALARAVAQKHRAAPYSDREEEGTAKPIVLLDELTAFMDSATEAKVYDVVEEEFVAEGHTVIIVSHRLGGLLGRLREGVDAVAVLKDGRLTVEKDLGKLANVESGDEESSQGGDGEPLASQCPRLW